MHLRILETYEIIGNVNDWANLGQRCLFWMIFTLDIYQISKLDNTKGTDVGVSWDKSLKVWEILIKLYCC